MPLVYWDLNRQVFVAKGVETYDPATDTWSEVVAPGTMQVTFREKGGGAEMQGVTWPLAMTHAGAGTKRWYVEIDGESLSRDNAKRYEALLEGEDQDGAHFEATEDLPAHVRRTMVVPD